MCGHSHDGEDFKVLISAETRESDESIVGLTAILVEVADNPGDKLKIVAFSIVKASVEQALGHC